MDRRPIYEQIVEKMSDLMIRGILAEDSPLPSVRNMAAELSINPNTVQRAYIELEREGYIYSVKGKGSFVSPLGDIRKQKSRELLNEIHDGLLKAKQAGIEEQVLIETVHKVYQTEGVTSND